MDDDGRFDAWFGQWKDAQPDMRPIGWYVSEDLRAAFHAGQETEKQRGLDEILERTKRLEDLLRNAPRKD